MTDSRPATTEDWPALQALLLSHALPLQGAQDHLANYLVVDGEEGALLACACVEMHGHVGLLRSVAVAPSAQGRGLARQLVQQLEVQASVRNMAALYLLTTTAEDYFTRLGFVSLSMGDAPNTLSASAEFQGACPASATLMRKPLQT